MAELPPSTSAQIADRAGLQERYVRNTDLKIHETAVTAR